MALNSFDLETTRHLALSLLAASGAALFTALNLIAAAFGGGDRVYAAGISDAVWPLGLSAAFGLFGVICAELAGHSGVPDSGHPHPKRNYLQTAFALIAVPGLGFLLYGSFILLTNATVEG